MKAFVLQQSKAVLVTLAAISMPAQVGRLLLLLTFGAFSAQVWATGFDDDDFIIAGFDGHHIAVFDVDFTFKGYLDTSIPSVTGLDFTQAGQLIAVGRRTGGVRVYASTGTVVTSFVHVDLESPLDIKVGPHQLLYVGTQGARSVREFSLSGLSIRTFGGLSYRGVAILPGDTLWAGRPNSGDGVDVFDIDSGSLIDSVALDGGQNRATSMFFSAETNTILMTDGSLAAVNQNTVFERDVNGALVRTFSSAEFRDGRSPAFGATRGPGGDVFVTTGGGRGKLYRWRADGTFVGSIPIPEVQGLVGIVWAGNTDIRKAIEIDIKPHTDTNKINLRSNGQIAVAVFSTDTFDATQVDPSSAMFGPNGANAYKRGHVKDVDKDGDPDMLLHFKTQDTGILCGDTEATLVGETWPGDSIIGSDTITTVNCP